MSLLPLDIRAEKIFESSQAGRCFTSLQGDAGTCFHIGRISEGQYEYPQLNGWVVLSPCPSLIQMLMVSYPQIENFNFLQLADPTKSCHSLWWGPSMWRLHIQGITTCYRQWYYSSHPKYYYLVSSVIPLFFAFPLREPSCLRGSSRYDFWKWSALSHISMDKKIPRLWSVAFSTAHIVSEWSCPFEVNKLVLSDYLQMDAESQTIFQM